MSRYDYGVSTRTLTVLVYIVTICWAANIFAPMVIQGYAGNTGVNGVMGALLGLLGAARYRNKQRSIPPRKTRSESDE